MLQLTSIQAKGIEKLGSFEKIMEAMDSVANDYISLSGETWNGLVICGLWQEEFQTENKVDLIYAPTFSKYRLKSWPLIAHEIGHHIESICRERGVLERIRELVIEFPLIFSPSVDFVDIEKVSRELVAEIFATYCAGTSYAKMLVGHLYYPPYFYDVESQLLICRKDLIPMPVRILIASAVLEKLSPELKEMITALKVKSKDAIDAENERLDEYIRVLTDIFNLFDKMNDLPFQESFANLMENYVADIKKQLKAKYYKLEKEDWYQRDVIGLLDEAMNHFSEFFHNKELFLKQIKEIRYNLKYRQTLLKQAEEFVNGLKNVTTEGEPSILDDIINLLGVSPFTNVSYSEIIYKIREYLENGDLICSRPTYILETMVADDKKLLNENAAIFSILLNRQIFHN
jgi:hypothetical protein